MVLLVRDFGGLDVGRVAADEFDEDVDSVGEGGGVVGDGDWRGRVEGGWGDHVCDEAGDGGFAVGV